MIYILTIIMAFQTKSKFELTVDNPLVNPATSRIDVTDYIQAMQEIRYEIETNRNELVFPDPIAVTLDNQTKKFFNPSFYSEDVGGDKPIFHHRYDGTGAQDYKFFVLSRRFGASARTKYIGRIVSSPSREIISVNLENETVSFQTEHIWYELANTLMREVSGIYEGHSYTTGGRKTKTISGKITDTVEKLLSLTGIDDISFDELDSFFSLTLNGHVYDLSDTWFITPVYREERVSRMTAGEVLGEIMKTFVMYGVVDFNTFGDGEPFIKIRNKNVVPSSPVRTIKKEDIVGSANIYPNWKEYSQKGVSTQSTVELFSQSINEVRQFADNPAEAMYVENDYKQGLTLITLSGHDLQVSERIKFGNHSESYLVEEVIGDQIRIFPGLVNYVHDQEIVVREKASELKLSLLECIKLKLKYPNVYVYERGKNTVPVDNATVRLYHNVKQTGHIKEYQKPSRYGLSKAIHQTNPGAGMTIVEGLPINGGAKNHHVGDAVAFVSRVENQGTTLVKIAGTIPKKQILPSTVIDPVSSIDLATLIADNDPVKQFSLSSMSHAYYTGNFKRYSGIQGEEGVEESGDYLFVFCLGTITGETVLYKFEINLKENAVDKKIEAEKITGDDVVSLVGIELGTIIFRDHDKETEHIDGSFVNSNPLNPDKDDKLYFTYRLLGEDGNVNRIARIHISDALGGIEQIYSADNSFQNNISWITTQHGQTSQDIYIVNRRTPGEIYKNGLATGNRLIYGTVLSPMPSLGSSANANDIFIGNPQTCWVSYDGYVFFTDLLFNKLLVYDPSTSLVWNIGESKEGMQVDGIDFISQWEIREELEAYRIYDFSHHATKKLHEYYSPKRRVCEINIRDVEQDIFLGDRLDVDKDAIAGEELQDNFSGIITSIGINPFDWSLNLQLKEIVE